jgi:hypothetical protein
LALDEVLKKIETKIFNESHMNESTKQKFGRLQTKKFKVGGAAEQT